MKNILFFLLVLCAMPAMACSCEQDVRTLEERIDDADRVVRVRVVAAELVDDPGPTAETYERWRQARITYRLRSIEPLKGDGDAMPSLVGQAGVGGGDCTERLEVGSELILFIGRGQQEIGFNHCHQPYEPLRWYDGSTLLLESVRQFVRDRTPIHDCDNLRLSPWERKEECDARQEDWTRRRREEARDGS